MSGPGPDAPGRPAEVPHGQPVTLRVAAGGRAATGDLWNEVGGTPVFAALVHAFYAGVATDPVLRPMYPDDLAAAERRLLMFLEQYWGGPSTYSAERGHPRLRMRHLPFRIDADARDRWLAHMRSALDALDLAPLHEAILWSYLERAAHAMVNAAG